MELTLPILTGFTLGCLHAFDADHLSAVTVFASKHPSPSKAFRFGLLWGLGHTSALMALGLLVLLFRFTIPPMVESLAEFLVGALLIALGAWALRDIARHKQIHLHRHTHDGIEHVHFHAHVHRTDHHHRHSLFAIGATHGLAGTASVLVIIPLAVSQSVFASLLFLLLFGAGTIAAMSLFAALFGVASARMRGVMGLSHLQFVAGMASITVGCVWIGQVLFA